MSDVRMELLRQAIALADEGSSRGDGGPFGAIVARGEVVLGQGNNRVLVDNDPTAHAEVVAIRAACRGEERYHLDGCTLYTSCEPCPMCLGAAYWSRVTRIVFAGSRDDAAAIGFDDAFFYQELDRGPDERRVPMEQHLRSESQDLFARWKARPDHRLY